MATSKARVSYVDVSDVDTAAASINTAIEVLEAAGFVVEHVVVEPMIDSDGTERHMAVLTAKYQDYLASQTPARVEPLYTASADSAALGNSVAEQYFDKTYTLAAGKMANGEWLEIDWHVFLDGTQAGGGNLTIKVYVGTQVIFDSGAIAAVQNHEAVGRTKVWLRSGANVVAETFGHGQGVPGTVVPQVSRVTGLTIDPTAAHVIRVSATFTVANAGNTATLRDLTVRGAQI